MASKCSTKKNTNNQNQPPSHEVKSSLSNKPLEFPTFDPSRRYFPHIPSQSTLDPTYTSLIEMLHGVTPDEPILLIPNKEVNELCQHTCAYLQSIGQIPIIYQIPRAHSSHRRT